MSDSKPLLSVIVLLYHGDRWIDSCVTSIENQSLTRNTYEILLVDNGGSTPSVIKHQGKSHTKIIHLTNNLGFAGGNNMALHHAVGDFIALMNQDIVVHYNCLEELLTAFEEHPDAGAIAPSMIMVTSQTRINPQDSVDSLTGLYGINRFGYAQYRKIHTRENIIPVNFISGNGLCFKKITLQKIGDYLFDHRLKSYAEDLDLSIRLNYSNIKMYVRPGAVIYHFRDDAFTGNPFRILKKLFTISSNRLYVYYNNYSIRKFIFNLPALILGIPLKVSRPDGDENFNFAHFIIALCAVPLIFVGFVLKVVKNKIAIRSS